MNLLLIGYLIGKICALLVLRITKWIRLPINCRVGKRRSKDIWRKKARGFGIGKSFMIVGSSWLTIDRGKTEDLLRNLQLWAQLTCTIPKIKLTSSYALLKSKIQSKMMLIFITIIIISIQQNEPIKYRISLLKQTEIYRKHFFHETFLRYSRLLVLHFLIACWI